MSDGRRSYRPSSQWYSTVTFWPSIVPLSLRPLRNAAARRAEASADRLLTKLAELKNYSAFKDRMLERPAVRRVIEDEKLKV